MGGTGRLFSCPPAPGTSASEMQTASADLHPNTTMLCRWGNTPLDEARRVGAAAVCSFLEGVPAGR